MNAAQSEQTFTIRISRVIHAPRERVFEAWISPEQRRQWWVHGKGLSACEIDARVGGQYCMKQIGACSEDFTADPDFEWIMNGGFLEVVRPSRIVFTWNVNHDPPVLDNRVTVELREVPGGTELTLVHEGRMSAGMRDGTREGWTSLADSIARWLDREAETP